MAIERITIVEGELWWQREFKEHLSHMSLDNKSLFGDKYAFQFFGNN